ncbi:thiolase family protein [Paenibacillus glycanilyticus]|uniref:Acetyl-CoA acetyltransferase n=1 Tax=Paenibacillus glycanilyticus TaxID=126569 RepID=A0ABQ6GIE2_9BACL|nr:thiolase family protein [Paenibacillus glycanilyticus]GLX70649.1 acetyl-CoA acetyltransferase [Paenibacillus glycanilyticus]
MTDAVMVMAKRTPIGKIGGVLSRFEPESLLATLIQHVISETKLPPGMIDDVIIGNVVGPGGNLARVAALEAGLPVTVPGVTVDRQCGSGLEAINLAARLIQSGAGEIYLAGGVESTSRAPWKMQKPHSMTGTPQLYTRARFTPDSYGDPDMGVAAENVAHAYTITREQQDSYALHSHQKAVRSRLTGRFQQEIVPIHVDGNGISEDECPRTDTSMEKLQKLKPVFLQDGTVTAGNACPMNDGAALVLLMSGEKCKELNLQPVLRFVDSRAAGVDPNVLGIGPVPAVRSLLERHQLTVDDLDLVEFNEAFASQVLASIQELKIPLEKVNIGGGAIALGHPYGASGAILVTRLFAEMQRKPYKRGIATLGIGGGMGLATLVEAAE